MKIILLSGWEYELNPAVLHELKMRFGKNTRIVSCRCSVSGSGYTGLCDDIRKTLINGYNLIVDCSTADRKTVDLITECFVGKGICQCSD